MKMKKLAIMLALSLTLQSVSPLSVTAAETSEENMTQTLSEAETETVLEERSEKELTEKETFSDNEEETKEKLTAEEEETIETAFSDQEYTTEEQLSIEEKTEEQLSTEEVTEEQRFTEEESAEDTQTEKNQDASESNLQVAYHTQNEIMEFLVKSNAVKSDGITFDTEPSVSAPYSAGTLSSSTLESATAMVNQVRYIAGLPYDVTLNEEYNKMCQAAALVNYVNGELSHTPSKPSDMESNLYNLGYMGASKSNIAWASWKTRPLNETIVDSWMADDDSSNISRVGHRRWILNPSMGKIGFGAVNGNKGVYSAMYAFDSSGSGSPFGVAWPAQNMPVDYFNNAYPWSVSVGETVDASKIKVKLTRKNDGKTWNFSQSSADGDFYINNGNYGQTGCIIFRPYSSDIASYKDGDTFLVEITQNDIPYINYQVNFFNAVKDDVEYTVTFDSNGGTSVAKQSIPENGYVTEPDKPTKEGYSFEGWFKEKTCQIAWDFSKDTVTKDTTLYAKWVENVKPVIQYKVTYDMQGHGEQVPSETVEEGALITEPSAPSARNYTFEGWYKDAGCQIKWDFESDRVSSNMTLYAKWIPEASKDVIAEGKIDEDYGNIVWSIDKNGKLLVTGRGDYYSVDDDEPSEPPWLEYKDKIKTAKISLSGSRSTYAMFQDCITLTEVDLSELFTNNVEDMCFMFDGCSSLETVDLSNFYTDNVYTMGAMFQGCSNLKVLDLSNFDTSSLVDMEAMFDNCSSLITVNLSNFKTDNVRAMGCAFAYCKNLTNLDLSSFDTGNVTRLFAMFSGCSNLTALDLSHFKTGKVKDMSFMFRECKSLQTLDISNFNTINVKEDGCKDLLSGCTSLSYIHAPKNCTYSVELPIAASTDKWYLNENTECTELPQNLGYSVKLYKNHYSGSSENSVVVKFDLQNHGAEIEELIIEKGQKIHKPTDPVAEGYTFGGWYKEPKCQNVWDFDKDIVTEDTTLYAKWSYSGDASTGDLPEDGVPEGLWIAGIQDYTYTGKAIKPEIQVYFKETKLKEGQDYTISYKNNIKAAGMNDQKAPTVTIKGKGNYTGTAVKTFTINKAMLTASNLKAASAYQIGIAYAPIIILNGNVLKNKTDYTLTYKTADGTALNGQPTRELGSYIMHIEGKGNCGGSFDYKYKLAQAGTASIEKGTATIGAMIYGGKNPSTMLTVDGKTLTTSDYTVVFSNTSAKGTATATFIGIGKYTGVLTKKFKVVAQPIQNTSITIEKNIPYEKGGARPEVSVKTNKTKLTEGVDYIVSYKGNTKLGNTAKAIVKGKGNYSGSISIDFQIKGKPLNDKNMEIFVSDVVAGKKPVVVVYDANGKKLSFRSDYEAKIDQDKHSVTITGGKNGCYTGTVVKTYKELPADKIITSVKLNKNANGFPKNYNAYTGEAVTLKNEWLTVKAKNMVLPSNCFTLSYMNNVKKGTATVIVQGKNGYSGIKTMTFKIKAYGLGDILMWYNPNPDETDNRTFTVRFLANGGSWGNKEEMTVTVKSGSTVVLSAKPTREGYTFTGWKDGDGNAFYENAPVTKDITVYAQWEAEKPTNTYADPFELPELTGDKRKDFIAVAMSQVGYTEAEDGSTCFGAWAGDPYCKWCSEFAAWCAEQAKIPKSVIPKGTSSRKYRNFFAEKGRYYYIEEGIDGKNTDFMKGYKNIGTISAEDLVAGDIILMESDGDINNGPDHTAIFLEYEDGIVTYVSGNANDSVMVSHCYIEEFHGVCRPDF